MQQFANILGTSGHTGRLSGATARTFRRRESSPTGVTTLAAACQPKNEMAGP